MINICKFGVSALAILFSLNANLALAQSDHAIISTEQMLQKTVDGVDLCFLPIETVVGAQAHFIYDAAPFPRSAYINEGFRTIDVSIANTGAPIVLIIRTRDRDGEVIWRLNVADDANLVGVHLMAETLPRIEGLSPSIPVTAVYKVDYDNGYRNDCEFPPETEFSLKRYGGQNSTILRIVFHRWHGILSLPDFETVLSEYAGINFGSYQGSEGDWGNSRVEISESSTQVFTETKARGRRLLDEAMPPEFPYLEQSAQALLVPDSLERNDLWPWIISEGYAMIAPAEMIEYNCEIDRLFGMSLGVDSQPVYCRWRGSRNDPNAQNIIVLLGSIILTEEICRKFPPRIWAMSPPEVTITPAPPNCNLQAIDIYRKTFFN